MTHSAGGSCSGQGWSSCPRRALAVSCVTPQRRLALGVGSVDASMSVHACVPARLCPCVCVCGRARVSSCMSVCVCVRVCVRACAHVCVSGGERRRESLYL